MIHSFEKVFKKFIIGSVVCEKRDSVIGKRARVTAPHLRYLEDQWRIFVPDGSARHELSSCEVITSSK